MNFCTVVNCMDGRVQLPVIRYLRRRFDVEYVDSVTEAGPNLILSRQDNAALIRAILDRVRISIVMHHSVGIAVVGHHDCAGNPAPYDEQITHIRDSVRFLRNQYGNVEIIGLWVNGGYAVHEVMAGDR